jgi:hypothetical protein
MTHLPSSSKFSRRDLLKPVLATTALVPFASGGLNRIWGQESAPGAKSASRMAVAYLETLSAEQRALAVVNFEDKKRTEWHFIPMETRKGLPLRDMNESQRAAALRLLKQVLSPAGYQRSVDIMAYEAILLELEGPTQAKRRDHTKFYFTIYGNPSDTTTWGFSVEGHHLSLNFTFDQGVIVDSTPQFFGVNPAQLRKAFTTPDLANPGKSIEFKGSNRLLALEEDRAYELIRSLNRTQLEKAIYTKECPDDIQWAGEPQPQKAPKVGIAANELDAQQQSKLMAVLDAYLINVPNEVIEQRKALIKASGVDQIYFGWAGAPEAGKQHFYRVEGPSFIVELCNFQTDPQGNVANHIHSIWRDMTGDFNLAIAAK